MSTVERKLWLIWNRRPFHRYTTCLGCGEMKNCTGHRKNAMFCLNCFDERGGK